MTKPTVLCDTEVYRNYFLLGFRNAETGNVRQFEMWREEHLDEGYVEESEPLDIATIRGIFERYRVITFNGNNYDIPIISQALRGATCDDLKEISDKIIKNGLKYWNLGIEPIRADHVDLFEVAPGMASLKIYGGRLHCRKMQDLPIEPDALITPEQRELLRLYNGNDLVTTGDLFEHLKPQIALREKMSEVYKLDLRSKSDAQIAEAVIAKQVGHALGANVQRPEVRSGTTFNYVAPKFIRFTTPVLQDLLSTILRVEFLVPDSGNVLLPPELAKASVRVASGIYRLGIGGLHSSEQTISHYADAEHVIVDRDVTSYYPAIILRTGLAPAHMGHAFTRCYQGLVDQRLRAKRSGDKVAADSLKITVNGSFGKLGSKWSKLYSPHLMIQTTVTGQLSLLMLIEALEARGIPVISANTDGVAIRCPRKLRDVMETVIGEWERATGFETEETEYRALHSRDVNNYVAIKTDGGVKLKGAYAPPGLQKNPANEVCVDALIAFLRDGKPVEKSIAECADIRKFVTIRQVNGGAIDQGEVSYVDDWVPYEGGSWVRQAWIDEHKPYERMALAGPERPPPVRVHGPGNYLGKAVRWYYAKGVEGPLRYKVNNYTVARSEGARAVMELPDALPADLDFDWYIAEAKSILADVGVEPVGYQVRDLV